MEEPRRVKLKIDYEGHQYELEYDGIVLLGEQKKDEADHEHPTSEYIELGEIDRAVELMHHMRKTSKADCYNAIAAMLAVDATLMELADEKAKEAEKDDGGGDR